jgi:hypothetical protein
VVDPIEERAVLPDGSEALVRIAQLDDPYIEDESDTVGVEVVVDGQTAVSLNTVLDPDQDTEVRALAEEIVAGLESGELEPTAAAIEAIADVRR